MKKTKHSILLTVFAVLFFASTLKSEVDILREHYSIIKKKKYKKPYRRKIRRAKPIVLSNPKKWQTALHYLGYYYEDINGNMNSFDTHNAVNEFQKTYQVSITGLLNQKQKDYLSYIYGVSTLDKYIQYRGKNKKANGKKYQAALKIHGVYHDKIDGIIGSGTKKSFLAYKHNIGLTSQGSTLNDKEKKELVYTAQRLLKEQQTDFHVQENINNEIPIVTQESALEENIKDIPTDDIASIINNGTTSIQEKSYTEENNLERPRSFSANETEEISEYNNSISDDIANITQEIFQDFKEGTTQ